MGDGKEKNMLICGDRWRGAQRGVGTEKAVRKQVDGVLGRIGGGSLSVAHVLSKNRRDGEPSRNTLNRSYNVNRDNDEIRTVMIAQTAWTIWLQPGNMCVISDQKEYTDLRGNRIEPSRTGTRTEKVNGYKVSSTLVNGCKF
jgi:hypothetical protein